MQRTVRRTSLPVNKQKWNELNRLAEQYAEEKNIHVRVFNSGRYFSVCRSDRTRRDNLVKTGYVSHLQARMWKTALKDGYETVVKYHAGQAVSLRQKVGRKDWTDNQKRYAYWLSYTSSRIAGFLSGNAPVPEHFRTEYQERKPVINYLRRHARQENGKKPSVKSARSVCLDSDMYSVFVHNGVQYIRIMGLIKGKRIVIPLTGSTPIKGNIRIVLDKDRQRIEVHYTAEIKTKKLMGKPCALDAGITEVFTDESGNRYGTEFGKVTGNASESLKVKGRHRNRLHQIYKKKKNKNIKKFNLGRKKQKTEKKKLRSEFARQINTATNSVARKRKPAAVITERLDIRGKAKSKKMSRLVSMWTRTILNDRMEFKALAEGFCHKQVNPAYTSQTCPFCGYVHKNNRKGDMFQCLKCGHADVSDRIAAINLLARYNDPEITLYTPKEQVKSVLDRRFIAGWKAGNSDCSGQDFNPAAKPGKERNCRRQLNKNSGHEHIQLHLNMF